jgi:hypothetical protein
MNRLAAARRHERGSALVFAIALVLAITVVGMGILKLTANDRIDAAKHGKRERAQACAEAGIQYGRRFFGLQYVQSNGWNDYLDGVTKPGYRFDPTLPTPDTMPTNLALLPKEVRGASNGVDLDAGADVDNDGRPDFWVSIRDDDDERPNGAVNDVKTRDNNEVVILRSVCTAPGLLMTEGGRESAAVIEVVLAHVQGTSGYGNAQVTSNSPDIVGER